MLRGGAWSFLRRARPEPAGDAVLGQLAERAGGSSAQRVRHADRHAAVHHQHAHSRSCRQIRRWPRSRPPSPMSGSIRSHRHSMTHGDPMLHQYNFDIQYQPTDSLMIEASYSGALGRDLSSLFINVNQIPFAQALHGITSRPTGPSRISTDRDPDRSRTRPTDYNAVNFRVEKRYSQRPGIAGELHYAEEPGIRRCGAGRLHAERGAPASPWTPTISPRDARSRRSTCRNIFTASAALRTAVRPGKTVAEQRPRRENRWADGR